MTVRVALISGPMYDALYARLSYFSQERGIEVEIVFTGDHPALNTFLATDAAAACHLVSTHTKYAPSQQALLAPLDALLNPAELTDFTPQLLALARIDGQLYQRAAQRQRPPAALSHRSDRSRTGYVGRTA